MGHEVRSTTPNGPAMGANTLSFFTLLRDCYVTGGDDALFAIDDSDVFTD
jgi:hypothetical protein